MVLPLQKLIHLHSNSDCDSEYSDWEDGPREKSNVAKSRNSKKSSVLSKVTKPFRSRRSVKEPPKSQDTSADLNGYIDAHKSSSVDEPVTRVSDTNTLNHCISPEILSADLDPHFRSGLYKGTMVVLTKK